MAYTVLQGLDAGKIFHKVDVPTSPGVSTRVAKAPRPLLRSQEFTRVACGSRDVASSSESSTRALARSPIVSTLGRLVFRARPDFTTEHSDPSESRISAFRGSSRCGQSRRTRLGKRTWTALAPRGCLRWTGRPALCSRTWWHSGWNGLPGACRGCGRRFRLRSC
ncbi:unnamed protein product, partial [Ixodes pacificus]